MALSGSLTTNGYNGRYLEFAWSATQDAAKNESTITWTLYGRGTGGSGFYKAAPVRVILNGDTSNYEFEKTTRFELWNGTYVGGDSFKIPHGTNGKASFKIKVEAAIYSASINCTGEKTFTLDDIPVKATVIKVPASFNDEEDPEMEYTNWIGTRAQKLEVCISLTGERSDIAYREVGLTSTKYKFQLTEAERDLLRAATTGSSSRTVRFYVRTTIPGKDKPELHYLSSTYKVINAEPTLNPVIVDEGTESLALTDNENIVINGYNIMNIDTGASVKKKATIKSIKVVNGSKTMETTTGYMNNVNTDTFTITLTDNRNKSVSATVKKQFVDYVKPTCMLKVGVLNAEGETTLNIDGRCFVGSFGKVSNTIAVDYRYKSENDENFGEWISAGEVSTNNNTYSIEAPVDKLNYKLAYTFQARVRDQVHNADDKQPAIESVVYLVKSIPVADWSKEDFNFNVPITYEYKKLMYLPGDSIELGDTMATFCGHITNGHKQILFTIPLSKPAFATGATFSGSIICRSAAGYLNGTGWNANTAINLGAPSGFKITTGITDCGIRVLLDFDAVITTSTSTTENNVPVVATPYTDGLTITFT